MRVYPVSLTCKSYNQPTSEENYVLICTFFKDCASDCKYLSEENYVQISTLFQNGVNGCEYLSYR